MKRWLCGIMVGILLLVGFPVGAKAAAPEVAAKGAVLMELSTGQVLAEQNAHAPLAPASVTKVMTMLLIMEALDSGKIGWEDMVTVSEAAAAKGGSQIFLKVGEQMSVSDMLKSVAVSSVNDCACALAEHICGSEEAFVDAMNQRAKELGMENTHFVNCTGLDDGENAKAHVTSAYDIALMSRQLLYYHPKIKEYTTIWMDTVRNGAFGLSNTNKMVRFYQGCTGLKTGYTSAAGYCLSASAQRDGMELVAVVLGSETSQARFGACKQLLDYGFANVCLVEPQLEQTYQVEVSLGLQKQVLAVPAEDGTILIDKGQKGAVTTHVELEPLVEAPVSKGQRLGTMTIKAGDHVLRQIPMVAEKEVLRMSFGNIFVELFKKLVGAK